jgi:hypothetical protein
VREAAFADEHGSGTKDKWDTHNEYEKAVVDRCYSELLPGWKDRLADTPTYLRQLLGNGGKLSRDTPNETGIGQ